MSEFSWLTIAEFRSIVEAELASSLLEAEGIPTFLKDRNMGSWYYQSIKLQVPVFRSVEAKQILIDTGLC